jgi:hypothetical protein
MEGEEAFAFVSGCDSGKPRTADRKLIRSHCMRGQNRRKIVESPETHLLAYNDATSPSSRPLLLSFPVSYRSENRLIPKARRIHSKSKRRVLEPRRSESEKTEDKIIPPPVAIPPPVHFADEVDSESSKVLFTGWFFTALDVNVRK